MKKKLDINRITNELEGASLFFQAPHATPLAADDELQTPEAAPVERPPASIRTPVPPSGRTSPTPGRRRVIRWPYDLYEDQVETLRRLARDDFLATGRGSASAMVRQAIDDFLAKRR